MIFLLSVLVRRPGVRPLAGGHRRGGWRPSSTTSSSWSRGCRSCIGHAADVLTFAVFFAVAMTTGWLTGRVRDQAPADLARAPRRSPRCWPPAAGCRPRPRGEDAAHGAGRTARPPPPAARRSCCCPRATTSSPPPARRRWRRCRAGDMAAARWAWEKGEPAGAGTGTLPNAAWTFRPLQGVKVARRRRRRRAQGHRRRGRRAVRRGPARPGRGRAGARRVRRRRRRTPRRCAAPTGCARRCFNSISHDLRTPLSTVLGSATTLIDYGKTLAPEVRADLLHQHPRGGRAAEPLRRRPAGHDPAGGRRR